LGYLVYVALQNGDGDGVAVITPIVDIVQKQNIQSRTRCVWHSYVLPNYSSIQLGLVVESLVIDILRGRQSHVSRKISAEKTHLFDLMVGNQNVKGKRKGRGSENRS
jgi:hypothetical protein